MALEALLVVKQDEWLTGLVGLACMVAFEWLARLVGWLACLVAFEEWLACLMAVVEQERPLCLLSHRTCHHHHFPEHLPPAGIIVNIRLGRTWNVHISRMQACVFESTECFFEDWHALFRLFKVGFIDIVVMHVELPPSKVAANRLSHTLVPLALFIAEAPSKDSLTSVCLTMTWKPEYGQ